MPKFAGEDKGLRAVSSCTFQALKSCPNICTGEIMLGGKKSLSPKKVPNCSAWPSESMAQKPPSLLRLQALQMRSCRCLHLLANGRGSLPKMQTSAASPLKGSHVQKWVASMSSKVQSTPQPSMVSQLNNGPACHDGCGSRHRWPRPRCSGRCHHSFSRHEQNTAGGTVPAEHHVRFREGMMGPSSGGFRAWRLRMRRLGSRYFRLHAQPACAGLMAERPAEAKLVVECAMKTREVTKDSLTYAYALFLLVNSSYVLPVPVHPPSATFSSNIGTSTPYSLFFGYTTAVPAAHGIHC